MAHLFFDHGARNGNSTLEIGGSISDQWRCVSINVDALKLVHVFLPTKSRDNFPFQYRLAAVGEELRVSAGSSPCLEGGSRSCLVRVREENTIRLVHSLLWQT
jgi:hypothetical protein